MKDVLAYKDYYGTVSYSADDEVLHGKIIGINDLVTYEAASTTELKQAFHEAVDDYIATCEAIGKQPQKTFKGSFNVRIPSELHKEASIVASQRHISLNDLVKAAIAYAVKHQDMLSSDNLTQSPMREI
ncbi:type II toxin-antitoxin system HicB family antitoxin [Parapedobacter koreensis]|uniref:Predicted nuclease of the RNAse H fold, HicB family n=1 Tax=Parapedobacter koreensis TaxID=332977 RepID=A0A1H7FU32_9SPHI|nr:type II toxin-antitoxin system HicB family antitoxin [Parapedobacter koreensis]SEK26865.1 Predicted nuclease of the RNAse H fold, HicB family [Parapedobacter koreensis]